MLDIWVPLDTGIPQWKDEDELEASIAAGRTTPAEAAAIRAEGERVMRERPWPTGWEDFEPDPSWPLPRLFDGWDAPRRIDRALRVTPTRRRSRSGLVLEGRLVQRVRRRLVRGIGHNLARVVEREQVAHVLAIVRAIASAANGPTRSSETK